MYLCFYKNINYKNNNKIVYEKLALLLSIIPKRNRKDAAK